jgi:enoyl-CoA hydratase/carnithine racemase
VSQFEIDTTGFSSRLVKDTVVVHLKTQAMAIVTYVGTKQEFVEFLEAVGESSDVLGYVQINDSSWDSHTDVDEIVKQIFESDSEHFFGGGAQWGLFYDVTAARFRNSIGSILFSLIKFNKPAVAGFEGKVSGEYLGLTLAFDSRIATADTTYTFDNARTGLPASPGVAYLMPRYIGLGRAMSMVQRGATIDAEQALSLGLLSSIVDRREDLEERCVGEILEFCAHGSYIAECHRELMLPTPKEMSAVLERYYKTAARSVIRIRSERANTSQ